MSDQTCNFGAPIKFSAVFKDNAGDDADPTNAYLVLYDPDGTQIVYSSLNNPSTGNYNTTVNLNEFGEWEWLFVGTGSVIAQTAKRTIMVQGVDV